MSCPTYRLVAVRIEIERALRLLMISRGLELQRSLGVGRALRELRDSGGVPSGTGALCAGCLPAKLDHPPNISRPGQIQCVEGLAGIKYALGPAANAKKPIIRLFPVLSIRGILPSTCNPSQEAGLPTNDRITVLAWVFEAEQGNADFIVQLLVAGNWYPNSCRRI